MDETSYSITRLADDHDLDEVAAVEAASFSNPWTRDMLARELRSSDVVRVYVLRIPDQGIVAFCACWLILDELHVNTIAVTASARRRGLATKLMRFVLSESAAAGAARATLEVRRSNDAARRLYERLGFVVTAVRPKYYSQPEEDGLVLWCEDLGASASYDTSHTPP
jgi:ribosomal-protein-alanine N-acetyltransferase